VRLLGEYPLHTLLVLTEKPGEWSLWAVAPVPLVLAVAAGWIWSRAGGHAAWGWATAASLAFLTLADGMLFFSLPRYKLSFGPAQTPILGLALARWAIALLAAAAAGSRPALAWGVGTAGQVVLWALMAYGTLVEPFRLPITCLEVPSPKLDNPGSPLRIVQLSDLHVERLTRRERRLPCLVAGLAPDLIVLTGDFLSTSYSDDGRALADLRWLLAQLHAPAGIYAVWGTSHVDLPEVLRPVLQEAGVIVLEDQAVPVAAAGHRLWLLGLNCSRDLAADGARLRTLLADVPEDAFRLLLYHTPDLMPQAVAAGVDLYLAGHTHGGQWRVPGLGAILTSSHFWKRYEAGYYRQGDTHLYVSRGLGMEGFGAPRARLFCPPEIVSVTLRGPGSPTLGGRGKQ
jgi:predicted MPP superfamily phosphohydrolase